MLVEERRDSARIFTEWSFKSVPVPEALKSLIPEGGIYFEGYANTDSRDEYGDIVLSSAWTDSIISDYLKNPLLLYEHDPEQPIGKILTAERKDRGLWVGGFVSGKWEGAWKVGEGLISGLSVRIRYDWDNMRFDEESASWIVAIKKLREISICSMPANDESFFEVGKSYVEGVKSKTMSFIKKVTDLLGLTVADGATEEDILQAIAGAKSTTLSADEVKAMIAEAIQANSTEGTTPEGTKEGGEKAAAETSGFITKEDFEKFQSTMLSKLTEIAGKAGEKSLKAGENAKGGGADVNLNNGSTNTAQQFGQRVFVAEVPIEMTVKK